MVASLACGGASVLIDAQLSYVDYIVAGSDSGRIVILEYNAAKNAFEKVGGHAWLNCYSYEIILFVCVCAGAPGDVWKERMSQDCSRRIPRSGP